MLIRNVIKVAYRVCDRLLTLKTSELFGSTYHCKMSGDCKPSVFFVLGAPGSGKGTQCSNIVEKYNFVHLSAGDLLREERNTPGSPYGSLIETHIRNGTIVPVEITCSLIERAMHSHIQNFFLIDGFPRNQNNLEGWDREMANKVNVLGTFFFDCDEETCMKRCLARGAAGSGRSDDNEESLRKRFVTYTNDTMPIIGHFKKQNLVHKLDGSRPPDIIFNDVEKIIQSLAPESVKK